MKNAAAIVRALACAAALLGACKENGASSSSSGNGGASGGAAGPVAVCAKEGEQCRYAEGKIGLCTARADGCDGGGEACLVCMSLH
jgi:hypothetical protein